MARYNIRIARAAFSIGELVQHKRLDYRGVVVDVDPEFQVSPDGPTREVPGGPLASHPCYHVLVHGSDELTYVAETHLESANDQRPIEHPRIGQYFRAFRAGAYVPLRPAS